ncbi:general substrate transporter [Cucurbitaria berberidis CBS 394.84]|uniref:General substrate transporter n=1 Tax=Cucurbitaria berberidis CBS 394.84 TaxID=1168544 RepID=A0A9P4GBJ5_9PLEO|nr:general substrate transporter [Cucurbitaria berberidis CBS 394.84]KAF1842818.1 general substrate transporter [Cucurbitaria berberidis CBS 394.84]
MVERKVSRLVPRNSKALVVCLIMLSAIDSVLVGYDSSLMGSFNVMPSYISYFTLNTTTKSLNTAISYVSGAAISFISGPWVDWRGRREAIFWSALITLVGGVIQGAAHNIATFLAGRLIVGFGMGLAQTSTPTLLAETVPVRWRGFAMGLYYACWGVGTLLASGVCYGTQSLTTTWAWRIPSLLQAAPSVWCLIILLFIPESPRWLIAKGRKEEALEVIAIANSNGNVDDPVVKVQFKEIEDTIRFEKERESSVWKALIHPSNRKRVLITATFPLFVMLPGTNIVTFYFGDMLSSAGIEDPTTQLQINVILTSFTLVVALAGSWFADKVGRKTLCAGSLTGGIVSLYVLAGLTAKYGESGDSSGIYGTIAMIFIYNATYAWGMTPLTVLYPPEVLSYDIRAIGMGIYTLVTKLCGIFVTMVIPFGMKAISWKVYIINASVDILFVLFVLLVWVETRGLTLEEVDKVFDGVKHSNVPDLETIKGGEQDALVVTEGFVTTRQNVGFENKEAT